MYWEKLGSLENEPTQLYVSLDAPNEKVYKELCNPQINDAWNNLNKTLELMNSFNSRTAIRITSVKGKNMINTDEYAKLINKANPKYVEVKAYMFVGSSRKRLSLDNMPSNQEVRDFAQEIADKTGRELTKESEVSRVVLLE
jgi:tRNA wybutosine-synthesizing protein 1